MSAKDLFIHLLLPHHTNNHRPRILHVDFLSIIFVFFFLLNIIVRFGHHAIPDVLGFATNIYIDQLLTITNEKRVELGLQPLTLNAQLSQAAQEKAQNMFSENYWAHTSPSGKTPWDFINATGYRYTIAGENLAKNFMDSRGVVDAWMASPSHKDNIVKSTYRDVGYAVVNGKINGEETTLVVQMFGATTTPSYAKSNIPLAAVQSSVIDDIKDTPTPSFVPEPTLIQNAITNTKISNPITETIIGTTKGYSRVPLLDIGKFSKNMVIVFSIFLIIILVVDALIINHKKIIRVTGHNIAHVLFLSTILIMSLYMYSGSIL